MPDRMEALDRDIVGIIAGLARCARPVDKSGTQTVADFLLLFVKHLLRHLLPGEPEISHRGDNAQADRFTRREKERPYVAIIVLAREKFRRRPVSEVTGRKNVRDGSSDAARHAAALGQMCFDEGAMASGKFAERMQRLHDACAFRPTGTRSGGKRNDGDFAPVNCERATSAKIRKFTRRIVLGAVRLVANQATGIENVVSFYILNHRAGRQSVLRKADAAFLQVGADLLVLRAIEPMFVQQRGEGRAGGG